MQPWLNRSMSISTIIVNGPYGNPDLIYDNTNKKLKLQTTGQDDASHIENSITVPKRFSGERSCVLAD